VTPPSKTQLQSPAVQMFAVPLVPPAPDSMPMIESLSVVAAMMAFPPLTLTSLFVVVPVTVSRARPLL
jgi:hypothetical protein